MADPKSVVPAASNTPGGALPPNPAASKKPLDHEIIGVDKVKAMLNVLPSDVPVDHVVWGYGGYRLKIEDLQHIAGAIRT